MTNNHLSPGGFAQHLWSGVMRAWELARDFTGDLSAEVWPEYLVTVSLAQQCSERRLDWDNLRMEASTSELERLALDGRAAVSPIARAGMVDLALYERNGIGRPAYLVEAKDAVNSYAEAVDDIIRLEQFLALTGNGKGSTVKMGAIVLLVRKKNTRIHQDVLQRAAARTLGTLQVKLEAHLADPANIGIHWLIGEVSDTSKPRTPTPDQIDPERGVAEVDGDEHLTTALIGVLYRKADYC